MSAVATAGVVVGSIGLAVAVSALGVSIDAENKSNDALNQLQGLTLKNVGTISLVASPSELKMLGLLAGSGISIDRVVDNAVITCTTVGQQGASGADGKQGDAGDAGPSGSSGQQGVSGENGVSGASGSSGQQGASGASGSSGQQGSSGSSGASGASGSQIGFFVPFSSSSINITSDGAGVLLTYGSAVAIAAGALSLISTSTPTSFIATHACTLVGVSAALITFLLGFSSLAEANLTLEIYGSTSAPPTTGSRGITLLYTLAVGTVPAIGCDENTIFANSNYALSIPIVQNQWILCIFRKAGTGDAVTGFVNGGLRFI